MKRTIVQGVVISAAIVAVSVGSASATATLIGHGQIKDSAVHSDTIKDKAVHRVDLTNSINGDLSKAKEVPGIQGQLQQGAAALQQLGQGLAAKPNVGLDGAYKSVAVYDNGGNGWATVACDNPTDYAIDGQIEAGDAADNSGPVGSYVIASFQGRMDWDHNAPKPGRTDGWVFGIHADKDGNSDNPLVVSAICVPNLGGKLADTVVNHY